ncbi:hypothetical protein [Natronorubrum halophilum]|uniref:hypothetical protein n=1 Tax=Natronorubrum halophilum TaxID=1702106 RepID=UPI000EF72353|nr:hypothetical protein [Natronorubrum halophilum]
MAMNFRVIWHHTKIVTSTIGYIALAAYMLALSILTFQYGGGFDDTQAIVAIVTLFLMAALILKVGFGNPVNWFRST